MQRILQLILYATLTFSSLSLLIELAGKEFAVKKQEKSIASAEKNPTLETIPIADKLPDLEIQIINKFFLIIGLLLLEYLVSNLLELWIDWNKKKKKNRGKRSSVIIAKLLKKKLTKWLKKWLKLILTLLFLLIYHQAL